MTARLSPLCPVIHRLAPSAISAADAASAICVKMGKWNATATPNRTGEGRCEYLFLSEMDGMRDGSDEEWRWRDETDDESAGTERGVERVLLGERGDFAPFIACEGDRLDDEILRGEPEAEPGALA